MNKKVIISILAVVLCVAIAVGGILVYKNQQSEEIPEEESFIESIVETTEETITESEETTEEKESSTEKETSTKTEVTAKNETETTTKKAEVKPNKKNNEYKIIYNKNGEISQIVIDIAGSFDSTKIKKGDTLCISVDTRFTEVGEDEVNGKYKAEYYSGNSWDFDLATKQGCREESSLVNMESQNGSVIGDGFPEKMEPYNNAVELEFKDDCVTITATLDKPVDIKDKNIEVYIYVAEGTFTDTTGNSNERWDERYVKEVPQPDIEIEPVIMEPIENDEEVVIEEQVFPIACS